KAVPADSSNPESWSGENKLAVVIETAAMNEQALSEYYRCKGLYAEQIARWREAAIAGNDSRERLSKAERQELHKARKKNRRLEKELNRKEKALAETAALLVLKKKPNEAGGGNYQTLINDALREYVKAHDREIEETLRKVIRGESC
ncbi:MAG: hypothetical protein GXP08_05070, partial [Gammaproteobacteria bacterium]|nr:hypothetical protein [Gammaproteobacteria bacterium]